MAIEILYQKEEVVAAAEMVMKFNSLKPKDSTQESVEKTITDMFSRFIENPELTQIGTLGFMIIVEDEYQNGGNLVRSVNVYFSAGTYANSKGIDTYSLMRHY